MCFSLENLLCLITCFVFLYHATFSLRISLDIIYYLLLLLLPLVSWSNFERGFDIVVLFCMYLHSKQVLNFLSLVSLISSEFFCYYFLFSIYSFIFLSFLKEDFARNNFWLFNPLSARIFTVFGHSLLEDRVLHKEAWVAKLLGTHLSI